MNSLRILSVIVTSLVIQGCATLDESECLTANWEAIGYEDGSQGYALSSRFSQHRKACAEHGISANLESYRLGHDQGIRSYCTPETGYKLGLQNRAFPETCPADLIRMVRHGYNYGRDLYFDKRELLDEIGGLQGEVRALDDEILVLINERSEHEKYLNIATHGLVDPNVSTVEKVVLYNQRNKMKKSIQESDNNINYLETEKAHYLNAIARLQSDVRALDNRPVPIFR